MNNIVIGKNSSDSSKLSFLDINHSERTIKQIGKMKMLDNSS